MLQDLRLGLRLLFRQPGFALTAILTLTLGIGANLSIFAVAWQLILKPLPYSNPDRLVEVWELALKTDSINTVAPGNYHDWRSAKSFEAIAAYTIFEGSSNLTGTGEPELVRMRFVTGDYFRVFGMPALVGRVLDDRDATQSAAGVVLSEGFWRRRFAGDRTILGRDIRLSDRPATVVGIMPEAFEIAGGDVDAWAGLALPRTPDGHRMAHYLGVVARLRPDVSIAQANDELRQIAANSAKQFPRSNAHLSAQARSVQGQRAATLRTGLVILSGAAGFVLLIACANLASLQLARGIARGREFAIRTALGASRFRIARQVLAESVVVAFAGALGGLWFSLWMLRAMSRIAPAMVGQAAGRGPDAVLVVYGLALACLSAVLFAVAPAWRASAQDTTRLRDRATAGDRSTARIRTVLVSGQVALAVMLLIGASVLIVSLAQVLRIHPGFDPAGVVAFDVSLPASRYEPFTARHDFFSRVFAALRALPGVTGACAINQIPFDSAGNMTYVLEEDARVISALPRTVTPDCFDVLRIPLVRGRAFTEREPTRVGIVTESFARAAWPGEDPVGRRVHLGTREGALIEVIGVVGDSHQSSLERRPAPQFYEVMSESSAFPPTRVLVRAASSPELLFAPIREAVRGIDRDQPVARLRTLETVVAGSVANRQFDLALLSGFASCALLLALVGIYGLLVQLVAQRRSEIGIRLALGATTSSVVRLVMSSALLAVVVGTGIGIGGALLLSDVLRRFVFGISATSPTLYGAVAAAVVAAAAIAAWLPARRAASVDPALALRNG